MNIDTARLLAASSFLPTNLQQRLWDTGDLWVRRSLARRDDLDPQIQNQVVCRPELIGSWARVPRFDVGLLEVACAAAVDDDGIMALSAQESLTEPMIRALVSMASPYVGWELLGRQHVPSDAAVALVERYVSSLGLMTDGPGRVFTERLGEEPSLWAAAVRSCDWRHLPIIAVAASYAVATDAELRNEVVNALVRLMDALPSEIDDRSSRRLAAITDTLLASPELRVDELQRLAALPILGERHDAIGRRLDVDLASLVARMGCQGGVDAMTCVDALVALAESGTRTGLSGGVLLTEMVRHRHLIDDAHLAALVPLCRGREVTELTARWEAQGRLDDLVSLARLVGSSVLDGLTKPGPVLVMLSGEPPHWFGDHVVAPEDRVPVALAYRPACALMTMPGLLGAALSVIDDLEPADADTAVTLLAEWQDDLHSLLQAVPRLTR